MTHWSLLAELAAQRMSQELLDAEAARRARLAEGAARPPRRDRGSVARVLWWTWGIVRAAYAAARGFGR